MTAAEPPRPSPLLLRGQHLAIGYRGGLGRELRLLDRADFELVGGELVCLLGPNGSGKSTLLRTIVGMQRPLAGRVEILGRDVRGVTPAWLARHVSIVLTDPIDVGALTARELVGLGRYPYTDWLGRLTPGDRERVVAALAAVDAAPLADRKAGSLSDGERQRVLVARALAQQPQLMVLDEPTAYLDLSHRIEMMGLLRRLVRDSGLTVLLSTHQLDLALSHADRVWLLPSGGPLEIGAPEDVALSGGLERTFASGRLLFDAEEGTFRLRDESAKPVGMAAPRSARRGAGKGEPAGSPRGDSSPAGLRVAIDGSGLVRRWTERALRRRGFVPVAAPEQGRSGGSEPASFARARVVDARDPGAALRFELEIDGERVVCASLHQLLVELEERARRAGGVRSAVRDVYGNSP